ncbi:kinase-like domain-containing protein, partial [Blyttiomyces helicus]
AAVFRETWEAKKARIRASSPYGHLPNWRLLSVIVKSGADLRQEQLALQLIREMQRIWKDAGVPVWVCHFRILITSDQSGLMETIRNAISVHSIKKEGYAKRQNQRGLAFTLYDYFVREFGQPGGARFQQAQDAFMKSLAAYSIICYILQIKDRHNGNILVDNYGHIIHIDFGFMLSNSPGSVGFELAPFKLPQEYVDILGGIGSTKFDEFLALMKQAFLVLRKKCEGLLGMVEMMERGKIELL